MRGVALNLGDAGGKRRETMKIEVDFSVHLGYNADGAKRPGAAGLCLIRAKRRRRICFSLNLQLHTHLKTCNPRSRAGAALSRG